MCRTLHRLLWAWLGLMLVCSQLSAHDDVAPVPVDTVESLVNQAIGSRTAPRGMSEAKVMADILATAVKSLNRLSRRSDKAAARSTEHMVVAATVTELRAIRDRLTQRPNLAPATLNTIDEVVADFDLLETNNGAARTAALNRLQARSRTLTEVRTPTRLEPPNYLFDKRREPVTFPDAEGVPAYRAAMSRSRAMEMYAFDGDLLLLAAAPETPAEAESCDYDPEDLEEDGIDIELTNAIRDKAEALDYAPARIFEFVANEIAFEPYYGALKGAMGTLETGAGSATDQASLLIALLRASNIPARYVRGRVSIRDETPLGADSRVNRWLQTSTYTAGANRLGAGANPEAGFLTSGPDPIGVIWSHVWVEACVPYAHYRGANIDNAGHRWIPLDPSFETRRYHVESLPTGPIDLDSILDERTVDLPHEAFEADVAAELASSDVSINESGYRSLKDPLSVDILPASLPYVIRAFTAWPGTTSAETAELPDAHRYHLALEVETAGGTDLITPLSLRLNEAALSRLSLGFNGATTPDQTSLDAWRADDDPDAILPCVDVVPVVRSAGSALATGSTSVDVCTADIQLKMTVRLDELTSAPIVTGCGEMLDEPCVFDGVKASDHVAFSVYAYQNTPAILAERVEDLVATVNAIAEPTTALDDTLGEYLDIVGRKYLYYVADSTRRIAHLGDETGDVGLSLGIARTKSKVERVLDQPLGLVRDRLLVDFPALRNRSLNRSTSATDFDLFKLAGYASSAYESYVWQENARTDAVSTVRGLQFANESVSTEVLTLTSATGTSGLVTTATDPTYGYSPGFITSVQGLLSDNWEVKIPKRQIDYADWQGIVYIHTRNQGGILSAGFPIQRTNGAAGGESLNFPIDYLYSPASGTGYQRAGAGSTPIAPGALTIVPTFVSNGAIGNGQSAYNTMGGDPVNLVTGNLYHTERDIAIPARDLPFVFERTYNSLDIGATPGALGYGWRHSFEHEIRFLDERTDDAVADAQDTDNVPSTLEWLDGSGARRRVSIAGATTGGVPTTATFTTPDGFFFTVTRTASGYFIAEKGGLTYAFENVAGTVGQVARLTGLTSRNGNTLTLAYSGSKLMSVSDDNARQLSFTYTGDRLTTVSDFTGREHVYVYVGDELREYKNPLAVAGAQAPVTYEYFGTADGPNFAHKMKRYVLPKGNAMAFEYYVNGRVFRHTSSAGETFTYRYNDFRRETVVTDARGFDRTYLFDPFGNPIKVVGPDGAVSTYAYEDPNDPHLRTQVTNTYGHVTSYAYSSTGDLTQITNPSGSTVVYSHYDGFGDPGKVKDARGNYRLFKYDGNGNLIEEIAFKSGVGAGADPATYVPLQSDLLAYRKHTYDAGNRTSTKQVRDVANDRGLTMTWTYPSTKLYPEQHSRCGDKDGDGVVADDPCDVATLVYDAVGRLTSGVNGRFEAVSYAYDAVDRITSGTDAVGQQRSYRYDANGNATGATLLTPGPGGTPVVRDSVFHEYDASDRRETTIDAGGGVTWMAYDAMGNLTQVLDPDAFTVGFRYDAMGRVIAAYDEEGRQATRTLDGLGREKNLTDPNGNSTSYVYYDATQDGRLKEVCDAESRCTTFEYDANGNVSRLVDNVNEDTYTQYDALNRPVRIVQQAYADAVIGATVRPVTCYAYDLLGNLTEVRAGHTSNPTGACASDTVTLQASYTYDDRGNRLTQTDALARLRSYEYDVHDNLREVAYPRGNRIERDYFYGGLLEALRAYAPGGALEATYAYERNTLGQVEHASGPAVEYAYRYDDAHRLTEVTDSRAGQTLTYSWSAGGLLDRIEGPQGESTEYLYDHVGRLRHLWAPGGELISLTYDNGGRLTEQALPGGVQTRYRYFDDNALQQLTTTRGTTTLVDALYTQDSIGRRATLVETVNGLPDRTLTFGYDALSRVTSVAQSGGSMQTFTYDPFGNRRTFDDGGTARFYAYDAAHQLDTVRTGSSGGPVEVDFTYDDNGNTTVRDVSGTADDWTYVYDARDRLTQAAKAGTTESYLYGDTGRRVAKTTNGSRTDYLYEGLAVYLEVDGNWGSPTARITHGPAIDTPLVRSTASTTQVFHRDGARSAVLTTDATTGTVLATQRFDAFGNRTAGSGTVPLYGYASREVDTTGLVYHRARYYDPEIGRFTQADPLGFIEGVNAYAYARNNPVNRADPLGTLSRPSSGAGGSYFSNTLTRVGGLFQALGGLGEAAVGVAAGTAIAAGTGGLGTVAGVAVAAAPVAHGLDSIVAGLRTAYHGQSVSTVTAQSLQALGFTETQAGLADAGLGLAFTLGAGAAPRIAARLADDAAKGAPTVVFSRSRAPGIAQNFDNAVANGAPTQLNRVNMATRDANRRAALRGQSPAPAGQSLDEYPFACSAQGGCGSFVRAVPVGEQSYQGGVLSRFFQDFGVNPGDPFNVQFGP